MPEAKHWLYPGGKKAEVMILVTGASGMIGRAVVNCLLARNIPVRAHARSQAVLDQLFQQHKNSGLDFLCCDFETIDEDSARTMLAGCNGIVHAAGLVHRPDAAASLYESLNVRATKALADAGRTMDLQSFVFLSSSSVYGNRETRMVDEQFGLLADTDYAASKIECENYLQKGKSPAASTVIIRPSLVFGEGDRGNMIALIKQILSGKYFFVGEGSAAKSLIYANDLANAITLLIEKPVNGIKIYNISNPEPMSVKGLSEAILKASGKSRKIPALPESLVGLLSHASELVLGKRSPLSAERLSKLTRHNSISSKAFFESGGAFSVTDLEAALRAEIEWACKEGLLEL